MLSVVCLGLCASEVTFLLLFSHRSLLESLLGCGQNGREIRQKVYVEQTDPHDQRQISFIDLSNVNRLTG